MRIEEFLITIANGDRVKKVIWRTDESFALDFPVRWILRKKTDKLQIAPIRKVRGKIVEVSLERARRGFSVQVREDYRVAVQAVRRARPVYCQNSLSLCDVPGDGRRDYFLFSGLKRHFYSTQRVGSQFNVYVGDKSVFSYDGAQFCPLTDGVELVTSEGERINCARRVKKLLDEDTLVGLTIVWRGHWWRLGYVIEPSRDTVCEFDLAANDRVAEDRKAIMKMGKATALFMVAFMALIHVVPRFVHEPKIIHQTQIQLKEPKWIVQEKKEEKKVVEKKVALPVPKNPVKLVKKEAPRKQPPKKSVVAQKKISRQKPRMLAATPHPAPGPRRMPMPHVVTKSFEQSRVRLAELQAARIRAQAEAAQRQARIEAARIQAQTEAAVASSLSFVSASATRSVATAVAYNTDHRYENLSGAVLAPRDDKSVLKQITSDAVAADGAVSLRSSRAVGQSLAQAVAGGGGRGHVLGQVSLNTVYGSGGGEVGGSISGGASGISSSGAGEISDREVEKALERHLAKFQYCYEKALLADSSLAGQVLMQWTLLTDGSAADSRVVRSQLNHQDLHGCIARELARVRFPRPSGGTVVIQYPFYFTSTAI